MLSATLVTKTGEPLHLSTEIRWQGKVPTLTPTVEHQGGAHFMFAPIYEVWGKAIPAKLGRRCGDGQRVAVIEEMVAAFPA